MATTRKPKLIAGLLIGGIVVLGGGAAAAAMLAPPGDPKPAAMVAPAPSSRDLTPSAVSTTTPQATSTPAPAPAATPVDTGPAAGSAPATPQVTYVVKRGDTLSGIAVWFKLHGYGDLYAANRSVIGSNPDLIRPGERITVIDGAMSFEPPT